MEFFTLLYDDYNCCSRMVTEGSNVVTFFLLNAKVTTRETGSISQYYQIRCYATCYLSFPTICSFDSLFSSADAFLWKNLGDRECVLGDSGGFGIL